MSFGSGLEPSSDDIMSEINMTPLVDVMLVLLIIFIVTVPVMTHSVKLELPRASNEVNAVQPKTITLSIDRDAAVHWNGERVSRDELAQRLDRSAKDKPQPEVQLRADRTVAYEHVMLTMSSVQKAGLSKLGFISEPAPLAHGGTVSGK